MAKKWDDVKHKKEDVAKELASCPETDERKAASTKLNSIKNWPPDPGTATAMKSLYEKAAAAHAEPTEQNIDVALKSYTKPKFAHNATNAGTLPKWTFQYTDTSTKKVGTVEITMTTAMTKDEPTAKKLMSEAAIARIQKEYPKAHIKINNTSLNS